MGWYVLSNFDRKSYDQEYYKNNRERIIEKNRKYYAENRDDILKKSRDAYKLNPEKFKAIQKRSWNKNKQDPLWMNEYRRKRREYKRQRVMSLIKQLGGKCMRCGYSVYPVILQFHHKTLVKRQTNEYPHFTRGEILFKDVSLKDYELLCPNCHCEKHLELGEEVEEVVTG